jgi:hypothetical protein
MKNMVFPIITVNKDGEAIIQYTGGKYVEQGDVMLRENGYAGAVTEHKAKYEGLLRSSYFNEAGIRVDAKEVSQYVTDYSKANHMPIKTADDVVKILKMENKYKLAFYNQSIDAESMVKLATGHFEKHESVVLYGSNNKVTKRALQSIGLGELADRTLSYDLFEELSNLTYNDYFGQLIRRATGAKVYNQKTFDEFLTKTVPNFDKVFFKDTLEISRYAPSAILTAATDAHVFVADYSVKHKSPSHILDEILQTIYIKQRNELANTLGTKEASSVANAKIYDILKDVVTDKQGNSAVS